MRRTYERPVMNIDHFIINEYIASCTRDYVLKCDADLTGGLGGQKTLYRDTNNNGKLDLGDEKIGNFKPCGKTSFIPKKKWEQTLKKGHLALVVLDFIPYKAIPVYMWEDKKGNQTDYHATPIPLDPKHPFETANS